MRIGVLVVVSAGQGTKLPLEAFAARIVFPGLAPAIAAPIAERLDQQLQVRLIRQHRPAFAEGDVMRRVETDGGNIAECTDMAPLPRRTQCVAAVLDQPQVVLPGKGSYCIQIEDVPQGMRDHDGPGLLAQRRF